MKTPTAIHLHSFCVILKNKNTTEMGNFHLSGDKKDFRIETTCGSFQLQVQTRSTSPWSELKRAVNEKSSLRFITGDASSLAKSPESPIPEVCSGAAAVIEIDLSSLEVNIHASLVGLPPIFMWDQADGLAIGSDLHLLRDCSNSSLTFSNESVRELSIIGYPIAGKTLFKDIRMLPAGHHVKAGNAQKPVIKRYWSNPADTKADITWHEFTELQSEAFAEAMRNIDVSNSFLSLTAGMDTRAILAALAGSQSKIPAYTMSGKALTLDARTAKKLSDAYGMNHTTVRLDDHFLHGLSSYCSEACRLTGGLSSLSQAHEVFFYSQIKDNATGRLSGNLGNQLGRGGAENISLRNAGFSTIHPDLTADLTESELQHWYAPFLQSGGDLSYSFLLEQEIPFSSVGNYCLGNNYATQQTPYAGRKLIDISGNRPKKNESEQESSLLAMRFKDLRHRFLGEPEQWSFQRKFIRMSGGPVAEIPINWGGKAQGGVSISGAIMGMRALGDAALVSKKIDSGPIYTLASLCGIAGVHEFRFTNRWLKQHLHDFTQDLFHSESTRECGLFHMDRLSRETNEYFSGNNAKFNSIVFSLDLALAAQVFKAKMP